MVNNNGYDGERSIHFNGSLQREADGSCDLTVKVANAEENSPEKEYEIYPTLHSLEYGEDTLSLEKGVQVVYDDTIDNVTKRKVKKAFTKNGFSAPSVVTEISDDKVNLLIGTHNSNGPVDQFAAENVDSHGMDFDKTDAYQLEIQ